EGGEGEALVPGALVDRAFSEEAQGDGAVFSVLGGEGKARGHGDMRPHDAPAPMKALLRVIEVHRAAPALGATGLFAKKLCHALFGGAASGEVVPVLPVGGDHMVAVFQGGDRSYCHRLLADVEVAKTPDLSLGVGPGRVLFQAADQEHL